MRKNKKEQTTILEKYSEKITEAKIKNISNNLLRLRTVLILQKRKLAKKEDSVQKYLAQREFFVYDEFVSGMELEFNLYKYLLQNTAHE